MSVRPSSADVKIINALNRRGVDGDFSVREDGIRTGKAEKRESPLQD